MSQLELDNICSPCRDRLKAFYEYFKFVLDNQLKFKALVSGDLVDETVEITVITKVDPTEFVTIVKDEPEVVQYSDYEEDQGDFLLSPDELKEEVSDVGEITVKIDPDAAALNETEVENVDKTRKRKTHSSKQTGKRKRTRIKLTTEERDEISREKDELIKKFIVLKCYKCPNVDPFPDFSSLMTHSRRIHHTEAVVKCCGREIKTKFLLASHLQLHVNVPTCEKCGETFRTNRKLESHRKIAHAICDICGVDLRRKKLKPVDVWAHMQQHALSSDPTKPTPFICDLCGKEVKDRNRFKAHIKYQHYDRVACICEHCGTSFAFKHQYTEHKRIQHPNGKISLSHPN